MALVFAVKEINENPQFLPNISLGFSIYNDYFNPRYTYVATMELLSSPNRFMPNYNCHLHNNLVAVIGGPSSTEFLDRATIMTTYKLVQVISLSQKKEECIRQHFNSCNQLFIYVAQNKIRLDDLSRSLEEGI